MFKHEKKLLHEVRVDAVNPNYAAIFKSNLEGLKVVKAALQYLSQSFRIR